MVRITKVHTGGGDGGETSLVDGTRVGKEHPRVCLLYTSPSPRDKRQSRMPSSA